MRLPSCVIAYFLIHARRSCCSDIWLLDMKTLRWSKAKKCIGVAPTPRCSFSCLQYRTPFELSLQLLHKHRQRQTMTLMLQVQAEHAHVWRRRRR
jgi:hypothetical protein